MRQLEGRTALVTVGTVGIGLASSRRLAAEGATVLVTGRPKPGLEVAAAEIGNGAVGVQGEMTEPDDRDDTALKALRPAG